MNENTKLTYHGAGRFIIGIPARNLSDYDLETIAMRGGETVDEIIVALCDGDHAVYRRSDLYICAECGKIYKTWKAMSKHELEHIEAIQETIEANTTEVKTGEEQDNG